MKRRTLWVDEEGKFCVNCRKYKKIWTYQTTSKCAECTIQKKKKETNERKT